MSAAITARPATSRVGRSRLRWSDVLGVGSVGLRVRPLRTVLTAIGIAIGIAALVAVMGISASSRADLLAQLDALGTNKLEVRPGRSFFGDDSELPADATDMIERIGPVQSATGLTSVDATVRRNDHVPAEETGGIAVRATDTDLPDTVEVDVASGRFLDDATSRVPAVVLGAVAAERLGIDDVDVTSDTASGTASGTAPMVWLGDQWFAVVGILEQVPLLPTLDTSAFIGREIAADLFDTSTSPDTVHVRTDPDRVDHVRAVLAATANPEAPEEVDVARPSDAVAAKEAADDTLTALLLGLGGVALLVGGIGIANVMVIAVLERRTEIGVRRALGATRGHIRTQFVVEAVLLAGLGGIIGTLLGIATTAIYAQAQDIVLSLPAGTAAAGVGAALVVGALAGLPPAARAARLQPVDAIRS